jgi:hypothetical protein
MRYTVFYRNRLAMPFAPAPATVSMTDYKEVGTVEAEDLEDLFRIMNVVDGSEFEMPQKLKCRSMCSGDVAVDQAGQAHYCASIGWQPTKFA